MSKAVEEFLISARFTIFVRYVVNWFYEYTELIRYDYD